MTAFFILQGVTYSVKNIEIVPREDDEVLFRNNILCKVVMVVWDYTNDEHAVNIGLELSNTHNDSLVDAQARLDIHLKKHH